MPDLGENVFKSLGVSSISLKNKYILSSFLFINSLFKKAMDHTTVKEVKTNLANKLVGLSTISEIDLAKFSVYEVKDGKGEFIIIIINNVI